ncbi:hypothetical protein BuS5_03703 [Desulfosarcina sp. BuS5]|uniref:DUF2304 domain-containing protein n=1 Tax=Desulfosarcina sp. BuS5 TaxID=933262 RepID=UPI0005581B57|nr:DUF2304 domain-containing protein [Desulfosarcina sp. BuS5]WDN90732.1 hypothetical protein BuS5_03703 [Desulfosarcina sp. BuS5]
MLFSYRLTSLVLGLTIAVLIIYLVRKDTLHARHSLFWLLISGAIVLFGAFPDLNDFVATLLGVSYPPIFLVIAGMGVIMIKMLVNDIERSRQEQRLRLLTERLAVMEGEKQNPE